MIRWYVGGLSRSESITRYARSQTLPVDSRGYEGRAKGKELLNSLVILRLGLILFYDIEDWGIYTWIV